MHVARRQMVPPCVNVYVYDYEVDVDGSMLYANAIDSIAFAYSIVI